MNSNPTSPNTIPSGSLNAMLRDLTLSIEAVTHQPCGIELSHIIDAENNQQPCLTDDCLFVLSGYDQTGAPVMDENAKCDSFKIEWLEQGVPTDATHENLRADAALILVVKCVMEGLAQFEGLA